MNTFSSLSSTKIFERNVDATIYVGNIDIKVTEDLIWELFTQCGPVVNVHFPIDTISNEHQGFAFIEFRNEEDAEYAIKIMHMIKLYNKPLKLNKATQDKRTQEIGANIFVGNLAEDVDEKVLKDIFSAFGLVLSTKVMRDPQTSISKHYGFVSFDNFDSSDKAIEKMNGQYIKGKPIEVEYAYKKDTKGEKHGSVAERFLAAKRPVTILGEQNKNLSSNNLSTNYLNTSKNIGLMAIQETLKQNEEEKNTIVLTGNIGGVKPPKAPPTNYKA